MSGTFILVLHSHLPFVRGAGRWPHGEEWVHEAILGTYLPLLVALHDLREDRVPYRITVGLTPTLLEQLSHAEIKARFLEYVDEQIARADRDLAESAATAPHLGLARSAGTAARRDAARHYARSYRDLREAFLLRFGSDVPAAFADLAATGHVEILTSAATHGYLPLLDERSARRQLSVGIATTRRLAGIDPTGIWLPECAYRPGLERLLEEHGIDHFFTDAPLLAPDVTGRRRPDTDVTGRRHPEPPVGWPSGQALFEDPTSAGQPRATTDIGRAHLVGDSAVAAFARHPRIAGQVWSADIGYPGDPAYREFHRKDDRSGLRYWRVTDRRTELGAKEPYEPALAAARVRAHALHFAASVREELAATRERIGSGALVVATFDSELFGHWWYEGVDWLALVLRDLADITATAAEVLAAAPPASRAPLREGSWGKDSDHSTWRNAQTEWVWHELHRLADDLVTLSPPAGGVRGRAARQAERELLLAQSSDWPFLVTTGQAGEYASERFRTHAARCERALAIARHGTAEDESELRTLERVDDVFPETSLAGAP